jgi:excinuclease UvrABC ATPase subunit
MQFLSDVYLRCPDCDGRRYRPEILEVKIERQAMGDLRPRLLNVSDVLELTVSEASALFAGDREVIRALQPIVDVGLEYVKLGQPVPTLSGGESQRLKLAGFLANAAKSATASRQPTATRGVLFLFDEPTTGLHFDDIAKLMRALRKLLDAGNSLLGLADRPRPRGRRRGRAHRGRRNARGGAPASDLAHRPGPARVRPGHGPGGPRGGGKGGCSLCCRCARGAA